jgi:putative nucleotidyltransferase with HDIG domain
MKTVNKTASELYQAIGEHLLSDQKPSEYLNGVIDEPVCSTYPFTMLLKLRDTEQSPIHHAEGNVWIHTLLVVDEAAKRKDESSDPIAFMWSALLHDIGKPSTTKINRGRITAYDHDKVGAKLAEDFLSELTDDWELIGKVTMLIRYHMHILYVIKDLPFKDMPGMKRQTDIKEVALLGLCDRLGRGGAKKEYEEEQVRLFVKLSERAQNQEKKAERKSIWQKQE